MIRSHCSVVTGQTAQSNHALALIQKTDTALSVSAARSSIRSVASNLYFLRPRARSALYRQVSETVESLAPASPVRDAHCTLPPGMKVNNEPTGWHLYHQTTSESSCPTGKVIGSRARVSKEKPTSCCPAGKAGNRRTPVRVPQEKLVPRSGKPGSITLPHASDTVTSSYMSQPSSSSSVTSSNSTPTTLISKLTPHTSLQT